MTKNYQKQPKATKTTENYQKQWKTLNIKVKGPRTTKNNLKQLETTENK